MPFAINKDVIQALAGACRSGARHMDSARATSVISGDPESPSPGFDL
jgi:hypothetical protein